MGTQSADLRIVSHQCCHSSQGAGGDSSPVSPVWVCVACIFLGLAAKDLFFTSETGPAESAVESGGVCVGVGGGGHTLHCTGITFLYCYS